MSVDVGYMLLPIMKPVDYVWLSDENTVVSHLAKDHPRPYRLRLVAEQFRKLAKHENHVVNFWMGDVTHYNACGTVACHGGWALHALHAIGVSSVVQMISSSSCSSFDDVYGDVDYRDGRRELAKYIMDSRTTIYRFSGWASDHPKLWGGENGMVMFGCSGYKAFCQDKNSDDIPLNFVDLNAIADRYDDVAYNIEQEFYK